jgi:hypothetical protein
MRAYYHSFLPVQMECHITGSLISCYYFLKSDYIWRRERRWKHILQLTEKNIHHWIFFSFRKKGKCSINVIRIIKNKESTERKRERVILLK